MLATSLRPPADPQCRGFSEEPQMLQPICNANQYQLNMQYANVPINISWICNMQCKSISGKYAKCKCANQYQANMQYANVQININSICNLQTCKSISAEYTNTMQINISSICNLQTCKSISGQYVICKHENQYQANRHRKSVPGQYAMQGIKNGRNWGKFTIQKAFTIMGPVTTTASDLVGGGLIW